MALFTLVFCTANAGSWSDREGIKVSPSTLNLGDTEELMTVHTDIAYTAVYLGTVEIDINEEPNPPTVPNDELILKADDRGNLVVKFVIGKDEHAALSKGSNTVWLYCVLADGSEYYQGDEILVTFNDQRRMRARVAR
jgi:hypothetical protein